jgi:hypothetical protein
MDEFSLELEVPVQTRFRWDSAPSASRQRFESPGDGERQGHRAATAKFVVDVLELPDQIGYFAPRIGSTGGPAVVSAAAERTPIVD